MSLWFRFAIQVGGGPSAELDGPRGELRFRRWFRRVLRGSGALGLRLRRVPTREGCRAVLGISPELLFFLCVCVFFVCVFFLGGAEPSLNLTAPDHPLEETP